MSEAAAQQGNDPTDPPPLPELSPVFAGADPIEEENQGNIEDLHEGITPQSDLAPPETNPEPPADPAPTAETGAAGDTPAPETPPAQADTDAPSEPVADTQPDQPTAGEPTAPEAHAEDGEPPVPDPQVADQPADSHPVPSYRLAQEAARRRSAEARAQALEAQLRAQQQQQYQQPAPPQPPPQQAPVPATPEPAAPPELDLGDNPKQMFDKVLDGDLGKATELFQDMMKQAVAANQQRPVQQQVDPQQIEQMVAQRVEAVRQREAELDTIGKLEQTYPVLNPDDKGFDKTLVDEVLALKHTYVNMHFTPAEAMERAAIAVMQLQGIAPLGENISPNSPAPAPTPDNSAAVKRNVQAQNAQPPELPQGVAPQQAPEIDIMKLSEEEFAALPETTIARLRGDFG